MRKRVEEKKSNVFFRFFKWLFIKNIGLKISAILISVAIWAIITIL